MKRLTLCLTVLSCASGLLGGEPTIVILGDGSAWFSRGDGSPTIVVRNIIPPPGDTPNPPPKPDPPKPPETDLQSKVTAAAKAIGDPLGATVLSRAFREISVRIADGRIPANANDIDRAATLLFFGDADKDDDGLVDRLDSRWTSTLFRGVVLPTYAQYVTQGKLQSKAQFAAFYSDISKGLDASIAGESALTPGDLREILELITFILELLRLLDDLFARVEPVIPSQFFITDVATGRTVTVGLAP